MTTIDLEDSTYKTPMAGDASLSPSLSTFNSDPVYQRRLSTVSKKFDQGNKGYLDETEIALRRMDSRNVGHIDIHKVYDIMQHLQTASKSNEELLENLKHESRRNHGLRRGIALLCAFTLLLAVSNIGTSFAAARLAQDTQVSVTGDLQSSSTNKRLGTTSKLTSMEMKPVSEGRRRRLEASRMLEESSFLCNRDMPSDANCTLQGEIKQPQAQGLYDLLCPSPDENGKCSGEGGVAEVLLNCNGHMSTIFGGTYLPDGPPADVGGYMAYPGDGQSYVAEAAVRFFGIVLPCIQGFSLGMYCPNQAIIDETGDESCLVFSAWQAQCSGRVLLCGKTD